MQDKSKFDELLVSYLCKELDSEDEAMVIGWINFDEQNRQYFEELKNARRLFEVKVDVDNIDVDYEWNRFKRTINNKQGRAYGSKEVVTPGDEITGNEPVKKNGNYKTAISMAVLTGVVLAIGFWAGLFENNNENKNSYAGISKVETAPVSYTWYEKNATGKPKRITLQDGSLVILSDKSEISYAQPFPANSREITLKGRAYFKVRKDKTKPFTVFSDDISTTALGTEFTVTAFENGKNINVKLHEGKVVVKSTFSAKKRLKNSFYLLPGQEFIYQRFNGIGRIQPQGAIRKVFSKDRGLATPVEKDSPSIPPLYNSWYMFNNQPLEQVFKHLEILYRVKILYSKKDIAKIYFISTYQNKDSIETILAQIARVNNLTVTKKKNVFIISK